MEKSHETPTNAVPSTPGQAEGSENPNDQSQPSPAPQQTDQAEGEAEDAER